MRLTGHVAYIAALRYKYIVWVGKLEGTGYFETLSIDGRIILKWV